jgi:hypothetical protein
VVLTNRATGKRWPTIGLIDSGARRTLIDRSIASRLGINLNTCEHTSVSGILGSGEGYKYNLNIRLRDIPNKDYDSPVVFTDLDSSPVMLLGDELFFSHFKILFEGDETFKLKPITRFKVPKQ